ncbi:MAG: hypothetical protein ABIG84_04135, partial [archaeon]
MTIHFSELDKYGQHITSLQHEPMKITASLTSPYVSTDYIFLDALISSAVWQDVMGEQAFNIPENKSDVFYIPLPIKQIGTKEPFYAASICFPKQAVEGTARWRKQTDIESKKKIRIGSGEYKRYDMPMPYTSAEEIIFYANGNKEEIERLLQYIPGIGKKRTQGYGNVRKWQVESSEHDYSVVKDGIPMRPIPVSEAAQ